MSYVKKTPLRKIRDLEPQREIKTEMVLENKNLKRSNCSYMGWCDKYFYAEIRSLFS